MQPTQIRKIQAAVSASSSTGKWHRVGCPVCFERTGKVDRRGSLSHNPSTGYFLCWKCGVKGFLGEAKSQPRVTFEPKKTVLPAGYKLLTPGSEKALEPARNFLLGRGLKPELWGQAEVGYSFEPPMDGRVIVPIRWVDGSLAGAVGRSWAKKAFLPYLYTKDFQRGHLLYNQCRLAEGGKVYVVEGVFDALSLWPNAVALLGKCSDEQERILAASQCELVVLLDGDAWADGEAMALRLQLQGCNARAVKLPQGMDPDEMDRQWIEKA